MGRVWIAAMVSLVPLVASGCGGGSDADQAGWTPRAQIQDWGGDTAPGENIRHAEAIVKHQREDHCEQRLIEVRCEERATRWDCRWRTERGEGSTLLEKHPPNGAIPVSCG
jgi:hypothetical protein